MILQHTDSTFNLPPDTGNGCSELTPQQMEKERNKLSGQRKWRSQSPTVHPYVAECLRCDILYTLRFTRKTTRNLHAHYAGIFTTVRHHKISTSANS
jgi:hypothetical protein